MCVSPNPPGFKTASGSLSGQNFHGSNVKNAMSEGSTSGLSGIEIITGFPVTAWALSRSFDCLGIVRKPGKWTRTGMLLVSRQPDRGVWGGH